MVLIEGLNGVDGYVGLVPMHLCLYRKSLLLRMVTFLERVSKAKYRKASRYFS
jgi:hypothetical protein